MKTNKDDIDLLIEKALSEEEAEYFKKIEEDTWPQFALSIYKGKLAWMAWLVSFIILLAVAGSVYCVIEVFNAESVESMIKWMMGFITGLLMIAMLKIWSWMQMDKKSLIRQIKQLEYMISVIAKKFEEK